MKKSMKKSLGNGVVTREPGKMYTWSPYTSNLFYTEPSGGRIFLNISFIFGVCW